MGCSNSKDASGDSDSTEPTKYSPQRSDASLKPTATTEPHPHISNNDGGEKPQVTSTSGSSTLATNEVISSNYSFEGIVSFPVDDGEECPVTSSGTRRKHPRQRKKSSPPMPTAAPAASKNSTDAADGSEPRAHGDLFHSAPHLRTAVHDPAAMMRSWLADTQKKPSSGARPHTQRPAVTTNTAGATPSHAAPAPSGNDYQ